MYPKRGCPVFSDGAWTTAGGWKARGVLRVSHNERSRSLQKRRSRRPFRRRAQACAADINRPWRRFAWVLTRCRSIWRCSQGCRPKKGLATFPVNWQHFTIKSSQASSAKIACEATSNLLKEFTMAWLGEIAIAQAKKELAPHLPFRTPALASRGVCVCVCVCARSSV